MGEISDDFDIEKRIGRGRFSIIHRCFHKMTGAEKAIKIIRRSNAPDGYWVKKLKEMEFLSNLDHPHIMKYFAASQDKYNYYLIMDYKES